MSKRYLIVAVLAFLLGLAVDALWHRSRVPTPGAWCDETHTVPFIDAEHCGGLTSCDRAALLQMGGSKIDPNNLCPK